MSRNTLIGKERVLPGDWLPPWTLLEHEARYAFSAQYVTGKIVVDCACGNGVGAKTFLKNNPYKYYGFDVDQDSVNLATRYLSAENAVFIKADALALPLQNGTADIFISLETIEHIINDRSFVREIARVLKPNGFLILSTPNRLVTNPGTVISESPWNQFHIREYSPMELANLMQDDFIIEGWFGQNPNSPKKIHGMKILSKVLGKKFIVRINQLWKCRWFLSINRKYHDVISSINPIYDEYIVLLCRKKAV